MSYPTSVPPIHPPHARRIVRASAVLWALVRLAVIVLSGAFRLTFGASVIVVATAVLLCWFDGRRFNEHLYHQNLGTPVTVGVMLSLATVVALEVGVSILLRATPA